MSTNPIKLNQKIFFVVTGASRGIGQTMAIECARQMLAGSVVTLLARNANGLADTRQQILAANPNVTVVTHAIDLACPSTAELRACLAKSLDNPSAAAVFDLAFIIHNVGTIGDISKYAKDIDDPAVWRDYYATNVFTVAALNSVFMNMFEATKKLVVNITSYCAIKPFESYALYCSGKAAREMYFNVLALEQTETLVLNYSPGPVATDMTVSIAKDSVSPGIRDMFQCMFDDKTILTTEQTTRKFVDVLETGKYASGDHVDYYDRKSK